MGLTRLGSRLVAHVEPVELFGAGRAAFFDRLSVSLAEPLWISVQHQDRCLTILCLLRCRWSYVKLQRMTPRQKRILGALAIADSILLLTLTVVLSRGPSQLTVGVPTLAPKLDSSAKGNGPQGQTGMADSSEIIKINCDGSEVPPVSARAARDQCQWEATQYLAEAQLAGTVELLSDGILQFTITYPLSTGQTVEDAAQSVWNAFDIALALHENANCPPFNYISVNINTQTQTNQMLITAEVETADLLALTGGDLTEEEFIDLVSYAFAPTTTQADTSQPQDQ